MNAREVVYILYISIDPPIWCATQEPAVTQEELPYGRGARNDERRALPATMPDVKTKKWQQEINTKSTLPFRIGTEFLEHYDVIGSNVVGIECL